MTIKGNFLETNLIFLYSIGFVVFSLFIKIQNFYFLSWIIKSETKDFQKDVHLNMFWFADQNYIIIMNRETFKYLKTMNKTIFSNKIFHFFSVQNWSETSKRNLAYHISEKILHDNL